jgi:hypothetical protein
VITTPVGTLVGNGSPSGPATGPTSILEATVTTLPERDRGHRRARAVRLGLAGAGLGVTLAVAGVAHATSATSATPATSGSSGSSSGNTGGGGTSVDPGQQGFGPPPGFVGPGNAGGGPVHGNSNGS